MEFSKRILILAALACLVSACSSRGMPSRAETWNSYYYGEAPARENGVGYRTTQEADDNYVLPRGYGSDEQVYRSRNALIPSHNVISTNPH